MVDFFEVDIVVLHPQAQSQKCYHGDDQSVHHPLQRFYAKNIVGDNKKRMVNKQYQSKKQEE